MSFSKIKTLLLYGQYTDVFSYYDDWKDAFEKSEKFETQSLNIIDVNTIKVLKKIISDFEFIIILHSAFGDTLDFLKPYIGVLNKRKGKLLSFVVNEYNSKIQPIKDKISLLQNIEPEFIGTQITLDSATWLYGDCRNSKVVELPHALNIHEFKPIIPQEKREIDMGVKTFKYQPFLGDNERNNIVSFFQNYKFNPPIKLDIDNNNRLNRKDWAGFLNQTKATFSTEAGSYYLEKDDHTVLAIHDFLNEKLKKSGSRIVSKQPLLEKLRRALIPFKIRKFIKDKLNFVSYIVIDSFQEFDEVYNIFFKNYPKTLYNSKCVSSRHFDAIGTKTLQVMFPGRFSDILKPDIHYIALERDFSNIDDVMRRFRDITYRNKMADVAYEFVLEHHTYQNRIKKITDLLE